MAALFFTNHRMNDVTMMFNVWRKSALAKMADRKQKSPDKHHHNNMKAHIEIDTELAN